MQRLFPPPAVRTPAFARKLGKTAKRNRLDSADSCHGVRRTLRYLHELEVAADTSHLNSTSAYQPQCQLGERWRILPNPKGAKGDKVHELDG